MEPFQLLPHPVIVLYFHDPCYAPVRTAATVVWRVRHAGKRFDGNPCVEKFLSFFTVSQSF
jgi:hypothetical protein